MAASAFIALHVRVDIDSTQGETASTASFENIDRAMNINR